MPNPLHELVRLGQSVWLDQLRRDWLPDILATYVRQDAVTGVTTNPAIFQQALASSSAYDAGLSELATHGRDAELVLDELLADDIRQACDVLQPVYDASQGWDGYVSHEVSPFLAHDAASTVSEARRLWQAIGRPNLLIKIPATEAGVFACRECLREGINVNMTLVFSLRQYQAVAEAYLSALEDRLTAGLRPGEVTSVASIFVSRIDSHVDAELERRLAAGGLAEADRNGLAALRGRAAVANSRLIWHRFSELLAEEPFRRLESLGARPQRVLWASTSTKNPSYSDVKYVEELAGPMTINTIPLSTLEAFRDHGRARDELTGSEGDARAVVGALAQWGIDLQAVGEVLLQEGLAAFQRAYEANIRAVATALAADTRKAGRA